MVSRITCHFIGLLETRLTVEYKQIALMKSLRLLPFTAEWRNAKTGKSSRATLWQIRHLNCWIICLDLLQLTGGQ